MSELGKGTNWGLLKAKEYEERNRITSDQDELLLKFTTLQEDIEAIIGSYFLDCKDFSKYAPPCAEKILAKAKQHYELEKAFAREEGFEAGVGHERKYGQKRLDRPELREKKVADYLYRFFYRGEDRAVYGFNKLSPEKQAYWLIRASELLALIPDIEDVYKKLKSIARTQIVDGVNAVVIDLCVWNKLEEKMLGTKTNELSDDRIKEAKKQVVDFVESYLVTTIQPDGTEIHHIDDKEWQSVKQRILGQALTEGGKE